MQVEDLILVSVDDHVVEPPDVFEGRLSKKAAERAPYVTKLENGRDVWTCDVCSRRHLRSIEGKLDSAWW